MGALMPYRSTTSMGAQRQNETGSPCLTDPVDALSPHYSIQHTTSGFGCILVSFFAFHFTSFLCVSFFLC
jgi:hypothetical protein